jgi:hypothetical protein
MYTPPGKELQDIFPVGGKKRRGRRAADRKPPGMSDPAARIGCGVA